MKTFAVLLLLAAALPAAAQQPEIVDFVPGGALTWTNADTNGYFGVEWTMDLGWTWIPFDEDLWNMRPSSAVCATWVPMDALNAVDWSAMGEVLAWSEPVEKVRMNARAETSMKTGLRGCPTSSELDLALVF